MDDKTGIIKAICISEKRGTAKTEVAKARLIEDFGIEGDAHAGKWHRQVSLLSWESVEAFRARGASVENGAFGENLLVDRFPVPSCGHPSVLRRCCAGDHPDR